MKEGNEVSLVCSPHTPRLLAPFFARYVTLVPCSLLRNSTETLATVFACLLFVTNRAESIAVESLIISSSFNHEFVVTYKLLYEFSRSLSYWLNF